MKMIDHKIFFELFCPAGAMNFPIIFLRIFGPAGAGFQDVKCVLKKLKMFGPQVPGLFYKIIISVSFYLNPSNAPQLS